MKKKVTMSHNRINSKGESIEENVILTSVLQNLLFMFSSVSQTEVAIGKL